MQPKFGDLFANNVTGSKESIFQMNYAVSGVSRNRGSWLFAPTNSTTGKSWSRIRASKALYDYFRGTYPGDARLEVTFQSKWRNYTANGQVAAQVEPVPSVIRRMLIRWYLMIRKKHRKAGANQNCWLLKSLMSNCLILPTRVPKS